MKINFDKTIVLAWLKGDFRQWQTFVGNRVSKIQQLTVGSKCFHIRSQYNHTNIISRGLEPHKLISCQNGGENQNG